jgi:deoxycytidylate deaminase
MGRECHHQAAYRHRSRSHALQHFFSMPSVHKMIINAGIVEVVYNHDYQLSDTAMVCCKNPESETRKL